MDNSYLPRHPCRCRVVAPSGRLVVFFLGVVAIPAGAAARDVEGLKPGELRRAEVTIALVGSRSGARPSQARGAEVRERIFGPAPPRGALGSLRWVSSSEGGRVAPGRERLMIACWVRGAACKDGAAVRLGPLLRLPLALRGPADERLQGIKVILSILEMPDPRRRLRTLLRHFRSSGNAHLVLLADAALIMASRHHRFSSARYLRLLSLASGSEKGDGVPAEAVVAELLKFPEITTPRAYRRWRKSTKTLIRARSWAPFAGFRQRVQRLLGFSARNGLASISLRRAAVRALARPPSFIAARRDPLDRDVVELMGELIAEPEVAVRRRAVEALVEMRRRAGRRDRKMTRALTQILESALERERSPAERKVLEALINSRRHGR